MIALSCRSVILLLASGLTWIQALPAARAQTPVEPILSARPAYPMPYGRAYLPSEDGIMRAVRVLPAYQLETQHPPPNPNGPPPGLREGWRVTLANRTSTPLRVRNLRLEKTSYRRLSKPYVTLWNSRPPQFVQSIDVKLNRKLEAQPLVVGDEVIEVQPHSAELMMINVVGGTPGLYGIVVLAELEQADGKLQTISSDPLELMIPNRRPADLRSRIGVSLVNVGPLADRVAERLLTLTSTVFVPIAQETNPHAWVVKPPPVRRLSRVLRQSDDRQFAQAVRSWTNVAHLREGFDPNGVPPFEVTHHGPSQAQILWEAGKANEALKVLTRYQAKHPDDPSTYPTLFRLLARSKRYKKIEKYWKSLLNSPLRGTGEFFEAGLIYARALQKQQVAQELLRTAVYTYPELVSVLSTRLQQSRDNREQLSQILQQGCRLSPYIVDERSQFREVFLEGVHALIDSPQADSASLLQSIYDACPEDMQGVMSAQSDLWPYAPQLSLKPPFSLGVIRAWLSAGHLSRAKQAAQSLRYTEEGESCELLEILGDLTVRPSRLLDDPEYAAAAYQRALGGGQCKQSRIVALKAKYALALARADRVSELESLNKTVQRGQGTLSSLGHISTDAGDAVVKIMYGWVTRNPAIVREGLWKFYELGGAAEQIGVAGFSNNRLEAIRAQIREGLESMESELSGDIPLPSGLVDWLLTAYGRERTLPTTTDSRTQQVFLKNAERFLSRGQNSQLAFIIRRRGRVFIGVKRRWERFVLTPLQVPLERWILQSQRNERNLPAKYLKPLPVSLVGADRAALEASMHYQGGEMEKAKELAKKAIAIDALHVDPYLILAQINAIDRNYPDCSQQAQHALSLDPYHPLGLRLSSYCSVMSRAQASKSD